MFGADLGDFEPMPRKLHLEGQWALKAMSGLSSPERLFAAPGAVSSGFWGNPGAGVVIRWQDAPEWLGHAMWAGVGTDGTVPFGLCCA
jgi:hypothetical protein